MIPGQNDSLCFANKFYCIKSCHFFSPNNKSSLNICWDTLGQLSVSNFLFNKNIVLNVQYLHFDLIKPTLQN